MRPSCGVYISQLIRFARASSHVNDFNNRNKFLTVKLLNIGIINSAKHYTNFIRHFELLKNYHVSLKKLLQEDF